MGFASTIARKVPTAPSASTLPPAAPAAPQAPAVPDDVVRFPADDVQGYQGTSIFASQLNWPRYNPDTLVGWKGPQIYDQMATDEQVSAVLKFKRDALLSRQWTFSYPQESTLDAEEQHDRIELMTKWIHCIKGSFSDGLACVLKAMRYGYSITEKVFDEVVIDGVMYYVVSELRPRPPFSCYFKTDAYGTLIEFGQNFGGQLRPLDIRKFVHLVQDPDEDAWFGRSTLRSAYRSWYSKDVLIKMQNLYAERMAGGFLSVEKDPTANDASLADKQAMMAAITNVKTIGGLMLAPGYKAVMVHPPASPMFSQMIEYHDLAIAKALLVPNLFGLSHTGKTGSYSQSQTQLETFFWTLNADTARLEATLNDQLFLDLCTVNWGDGEYPRFTFKPASEDFVKWVVGQWTALIAGNAVITTEADEDHLRRILNMPARTDEDKPLAQTKAEQATKMPLPPGGGGSQPGTTGSESPSARGAVPTDAGGPENFSRAHTPDGKPRSCSLLAFTRASSRVQFAVIDQRSEAMALDAAQTLAPLIAGATWRVVKRAKEFLKDPETVQDARFSATDIGRINKTARGALQRGWDLGARQAQQELQRAKTPSYSRLKFDGLRGDMAAQFLDANSFRMAGNMTDAVRAIIQQELLNGIKSDGRPEVVAQAIFQRLINKGYTSLEATQDSVDDRDVTDALEQAIGASTAGGTLAYLNTLARTNIFESLNEARFAAFTDPGLNGFVEALEYSAILDDRTTEICQNLDGDTYDADSDVWDTYRPPNHYNCRSILVPVTQTDGWDGTESDPPTVTPQDGFGAGEK